MIINVTTVPAALRKSTTPRHLVEGVRRSRRHLRYTAASILLAGLAGCGVMPQKPEPPVAAALCTAKLTEVPRPVHHRPREQESWKQLKKDVTKAERYVGLFWTTHWRDCFDGATYTPPELKGIYSSAYPVRCNGKAVSADNAFYCPDGKFLAFGDELMQRGADVGNAWEYLIVAHEWAHSVQDQLRGTRYESYVAKDQLELQADCLAGAALWGSDYEGVFEWQANDSQNSAIALLVLADKTPWTKVGRDQPLAHGDGLERVAAFQDGRHTDGTRRCWTDYS